MEKSSYIYEKFATDLETDSAKAKKKDILGIFENYNSLRSETEYKRIEFGLHEACKKGDFELIKIFLNETIKKESPSLAFRIDKANKTASLMNNYNDSEFLVIPRTVKHESTDYLITSILSVGSKIKTLKFSDDSSVKKIFGHSLSNFSIEEIHFPASLTELKDGWCNFSKQIE